MKWFKHETSAHTDAKLKKLRIRYGLEGLGLYWYCLELIGQSVEPHNLTFELEHDSEVIADDLGVHIDHVQEMMHYMIELGLFEQNGVIITCFKMAIRADEYTQKSIRKAQLSGHTPDALLMLSGHTPDKIHSNRKKERNNNSANAHCAFDTFWSVYPRKENKKRAEKAFLNLSKTKQQKAIHDVRTRFAETDKQFVPHPTTYINGERWEDEKPSNDGSAAFIPGGI